ncbi:hypothetical protein FRC01_001504 [Tulasnella sp. 417]|nr:hypothetical protein FRC01_001504 [Tulasnella sp. 417]
MFDDSVLQTATCTETQPDDAFETETASSYKTARESQTSSLSSHLLFEYEAAPEILPAATGVHPPDESSHTETTNSHPIREIVKLRLHLRTPSSSMSILYLLCQASLRVRYQVLLDPEDVDCERSVDDPALKCFSPVKFNTIGMTGSADNDIRSVGKEGGKSGSVKVGSLKAVAPSPSTGVLHPENCSIIINVAPPSPPDTIKPSQAKQSNENMMTDPKYSSLVPHGRHTRTSPVIPDHPRFESPNADMVVATRPAEAHPSPGNVEENQRVGYEAISSQHVARIHSSDHSPAKVVLSLVKGENDGLTAPVQSEMLSARRGSPTTQPFDSSVTLVDEYPSLDAPNLFDMSAGGKAEPLTFDAPIDSTRVIDRKSRKAKRFEGRLVLDSVRKQARAIKLSISSSLSGFGNAASRLFSGRRPAKVEGNRTFNPYFDPWEGFVPSRGPSPDPMDPDGDVPPPRPSIMNIYVKLD